MAARYCRAFTSLYPFAEGTDLLYSAATRKAEQVPREDARLIHGCHQFRTLEQHGASLQQSGGGTQAGIVERLKTLAERGFLIRDDRFLAQIQAAASTEGSPPSIATVGATTRSRPELLARGLASFTESAVRCGRSHDYVVIDDGATLEEQSATKGVLEGLSRERGLTIRYAGRTERQSYADALAAAGLEPEVVRFALVGDTAFAVTTGAARNSLLLDTTGDLCLLVDDDSVCRAAGCPQFERGLAFDARTNPTELWFYRDRDSMLADAGFVDDDPLEHHESILGRRLADCLPPNDPSVGVDLSYTTADFGWRLWAHPGRVLATSAGVVGDSGMGSTAYLVLAADSLARLVRSEQDYVSAVTNRQILRAPLRTTISRGTFCAGASLGLDNRVLLPPFVPVQRNSDGLFARTLLRCFRDGYKGYLPWAVLHDPLPPRTQSIEGAHADAARIRLTHILRALILPAAFTQSGDPAVDLRRLGEELIEIASQPPDDFQHTIRPRIARAAGLYLDSMEQAAKSVAVPEFYAARQKTYRQHLSQALATGEYFIPRDVAEGGTGDEIQQAAQRVVLQFGRVLRAWPAMVEAAKMLRGRGVRLAQPV